MKNASQCIRIIILTAMILITLSLLGCDSTDKPSVAPVNTDTPHESTLPTVTTAPETSSSKPDDMVESTNTTESEGEPESKPETEPETDPETETQPDPAPHIPDGLVVVTDQKAGQEGIAVYDLSGLDLSHYDFEQEYMEIDPAQIEVFRYTEGLYDVAGVKLRTLPSTGEYVLMVAYGGSYAAMISYPKGELLWSTSLAGQGPHSIELLPEEWIVVAAPGHSANDYADGTLTFFNPKRTQPRLSVNLPNAHGVLYDPEGNYIWAVGGDRLVKYSYVMDAGRIHVAEELTVTLPSSGAHDLAAYYGDTDKLIVTTTEKAYVYQKSTNSFLTASEDGGIKSAKRIKGIGILQDGSVVFTRPNEVLYPVRSSWLTDCIVYHKRVDGELIKYRLVSDQYEIYKIRVMRAEYQ